MTLLTLYLLFLKATITAFSGGTTLPSVRQDFVVQRHIISDAQLSSAVAISRMGPGPNGAFVVCVGHYIAGPAGAAAGYLAMITPAWIAILILRLLAGRTDHPRWRGAIQGLTAAAAGLMLANSWPIAQHAITSWFPALLSLLALAAFLSRKIETVWVLAGAGLLAILGALAGIEMLYSRVHA
ncbi:MAG: chromate transporter [Bryobacteraceae bacterium]